MPAGMMGAGGAGQQNRRDGHTPPGYLVNATNAGEIVGEVPTATPAVLGPMRRRRMPVDVAPARNRSETAG